jgi:hypothetical protein
MEDEPMKFALSLVAGALLFAAPATAGGDYGYGWYDGWSPRHHWRGYRAYYGPPVYVPRVYAVPYAYPVPYEVGDYYGYGYGDCEIERRWRHGRLYEEVDCDD